jgi:peptidoglycan/xylan/chitin deacetylase (PgdA/CDA1 family)
MKSSGIRLAGKLANAAGIRRRDIAAARMYCERHLLASVVRRGQRNVGRILCYHSVGQPDFGVNDVSPSLFRRHIELAQGSGYRFVYASEIARTGGNSGDLAITFDDGLCSVLTCAAPILREYRVPWSFFPVSEWCEHHSRWGPGVMMSWRDVEQLAAQGGELGSHSATHPDFGKLDPSRLTEELVGSRRMIERRVGIVPMTFAIPLGQSMNWTPAAAAAAREAGYEFIYAQAEETRPAGTIARTFVTTFDRDRTFGALLSGAYDRWEEWI